MSLEAKEKQTKSAATVIDSKPLKVKQTSTGEQKRPAADQKDKKKATVQEKLLAAKQRREAAQAAKESGAFAETPADFAPDPFNTREKKLLKSFGEGAPVHRRVEMDNPDALFDVKGDTRTEEEKDSDPTLDGRCQQILPRLFLGDVCSACAPERLKRLGIGAIVNCAYEVRNRYPDKFVYHHISVVDKPETTIHRHFESAFAFIDEHRKSHGVLVHCLAGASRSATVVVGYLMKIHKLTLHDAFWHVKQRRLCVWPNPGFVGQLAALEKAIGVEPVRVPKKADGEELEPLCYTANGAWMQKPVREVVPKLD